MKVEVTKILAEGCYKRWMWLNINSKTLCIRITEALYQELKSIGVPTSQALRSKKK